MPRGGARPGAGRPPGSKRTAEVLEMMRAKEYDPVAKLIDEALDANTTRAERLEIHKALLPFCTPRLQAVEISETGPARRPPSLDDLLAAVAETKEKPRATRR